MGATTIILVVVPVLLFHSAGFTLYNEISYSIRDSLII